ncbi:MAG: hypothetical protein UW79_C0009G0007 [Candidatus Yanofskybacteria bacterium GW2011_GWA2_44_9]|uniref:Bacterial type II secretion system protein E domain-containing protein n=1 Tax=Candidatus Yanofskybacteria bacterium GW2011_GWA2_44_9 TaxID=1619025 RepID=A0A0G1KFH1_9BACT|nr:MAG: hypothetical protein UW79_C0009G0007 [Candidatus Yanofskybacteria bacterium GW2011_GWA2_44_9]
MAPSQIRTKEEELEKKLQDIAVKESEEKYHSLASGLNLPFSNLKGVPIDRDALHVINEDTARSSNLAVLYKTASKLIIAVTDPSNPATQKTIESLKKPGLNLEIMITTPEALERVWARYKSSERPQVFEVGAIEIDEEELSRLEDEIKTIADLKSKITNVSVTKLLEILMAGALKTRASDIHFEPERTTARLRYRLDGILYDVATIDHDYYNKILNRIKILSKLKLNVHGPQEGRFSVRQKNNNNVDLRISILPSEFGETVVMRILDPFTVRGTLEDLGLRKDILDFIKEKLKINTGTVLVSGPTGVGKTTTLYAFVNYINSSKTKILTIEDPIEYHIQGISQSQVDPAKNYTFANGLKIIMRQNPDVILVGEIRDMETADIALNASLTGHLVLSTIHANNAAGAIPRLVDLHVKPEILAPALNLVISQRLIRKLCGSCKILKKVSPGDLTKIKKILEPISGRIKFPDLSSSLKIYYPGQCAECSHLGYSGRLGSFEVFSVSKELEKLMSRPMVISEVNELLVSEGMVTMVQDGYLKLLEGITSLEELERVFG